MPGDFLMFHRPVALTPEGEAPLGDWTDNWKEAQAVLFQRGLAGYAYGIFVMHPAVTIKHEVQYQ